MAYFAKRNTKFGGGGKARAGKNSFPPIPVEFLSYWYWVTGVRLLLRIRERILRAVDHANERAQQVVSIEMLMDGGWEIILTASDIVDAQEQLETLIR